MFSRIRSIFSNRNDSYAITNKKGDANKDISPVQHYSTIVQSGYRLFGSLAPMVRTDFRANNFASQDFSWFAFIGTPRIAQKRDTVAAPLAFNY